MADRLQPLDRRHDPRPAADLQSAVLTQSHIQSRLADGVLPDEGAEVTEVGVARLRKGGLKADGTVVAQAFEVNAVPVKTAWAEEGGVLAELVFPRGGDCGDNLESRPRRVVTGNRSIHLRLIGVVVQLLPLLIGDAAFEQILVERGAARHAQHLACAWV